MLRFPDRRIATLVLTALCLVGATVVTASEANATPAPTFGPQFDLASGFSQPYGVGVDPQSNVYVADASAKVVYRVPGDGGPTTTVASGLGLPLAVTTDPFGNVYVADWQNGTVVEIAGGTGSPSTIVTGLSAPRALAFSPFGGLYIAAGGSVYKYTDQHHVLETFASGFVLPSGIVIDTANNVYVSDGANAANSVTEIAPDGTRTVLPITGLNNPNQLALDGDGNLFIANGGSNNVLMRTPDGTTTTVGGGYISPEGVATNSAGDVIVADTYFPRVSVNPRAEAQTITLKRRLPTAAAPGSEAVLSASGGASGNPVVFSVDPSTYPADACKINGHGTRVLLTSVGTCVLDLDQGGSLRYLAAHRTASIRIQPAGVASLVVQPPAAPVLAGPIEFTVHGLDASGNDLGDISAITRLTLNRGSCDRTSCYVDTAGPLKVQANAAGARAGLSIGVALNVALASAEEPVTSIPATVGTAVDAAVFVFGGDSGTYKYSITAGVLPPGVRLRADGTFAGAPQSAGTYPITVSVRDKVHPSQAGSISGDFTVSP